MASCLASRERASATAQPERTKHPRPRLWLANDREEAPFPAACGADHRSAVLTIGLRRPIKWLDLFLPTVSARMDDRVKVEVIHGIIPGNWGIRFCLPSLAESLSDSASTIGVDDLGR